MIVNRQVFYQQLLEHRGHQWAELSRQHELRSGVAASMTGAFLPGFERERTLRVLSRITNETLANRNSRFDAGSSEPENLRRWAASTPTLPLTTLDDLGTRDAGRYLPQFADRPFRQALIQEIGTTTIVALQLYHLQHGEFPPSLSDGIPSQLTSQLEMMEPAVKFNYERQGLPADLYLPYGLVIPAHQPLLYTPGIDSHRIARAQHNIIGGKSATIPRGALYQVGPPFTPREGVLGWQTLDPAQVVYLDLTTTEADVLELSVAPREPDAAPAEPMGADGVLYDGPESRSPEHVPPADAGIKIQQ
jgi:hypothetical protein